MQQNNGKEGYIIIRYATIGSSWIVAEFIKGARLTPELEWSAMYSRKEETAKAFMHTLNEEVTIYTSLLELAKAPSVEGVYVASPNALHYEQCKMLLEHGKHIICEKSVTAKGEQTKELVRLAREKGLVFMEAIMMLHCPQRKILLEAMKKIGNITTAHVDVSKFSSKYPQLMAGELPNIFNPRLAAGGLMDMGVYGVYPVLDWFGVPQKLHFSAGFLSSGADGYGSAQFIYPDRLVTMSYSKVGQSCQGSQIMGDKGTIVIDRVTQLTGMRVIWQDGSREELFGGAEKSALMGNEARSFYHYVTNPEQYREEYQYATHLMMQVSETMEAMRSLAEFPF
ncbi:Gfo/Idh/MocA family oxidoreductase [Oscillospiraceae bacterium MB08-C2-2]|nr:Gfo/Idh/MocA family oxidoreductase [Oscillospiraceae bacterium MB08-C2-2]